MIKNIVKIIAKDFVENTLEKNQDTNIYANLTNHSLSITDIIVNFSKYIIFGIILISFFNIFVSVLVYYLFSNIFLTFISFILSNITTIVLITKLIKNTKREIFKQITKTIALMKNES